MTCVIAEPPVPPALMLIRWPVLRENTNPLRLLHERPEDQPSGNRRGDGYPFVHDPGRHGRAAVAARCRDQTVDRAAFVEKSISGLQSSVGLAASFQDQGAFEDVAALVSGMGMKSDRGVGRQHGGADDDFLAGYTRLVMMLDERAHRLWLGFVGSGIQGQSDRCDEGQLKSSVQGSALH